MKTKIIFILCCFSVFIVRAEDYILSEITQRAYWLDSTIIMNNYTVVQSAQNDMLYIVPDSCFIPKGKSQNRLSDLSCGFYDDDAFGLTWGIAADDSIRKTFRARNNDFMDYLTRECNADFPMDIAKGRKDRICIFTEKKPTVFRVFLIQGKLYNHIKTDLYITYRDKCISPKKIKFKDENAYYRVYVPIR